MEARYDIFNQSSTVRLLIGDFGLGIMGGAALWDRFSIRNPQSQIRNCYDRLEGFRPGGHSMYQRVMVAVLCGRTSIPAWTYWMPCPSYAERVASGEWLRP